jgi:ribosomal protein L17
MSRFFSVVQNRYARSLAAVLGAAVLSVSMVGCGGNGSSETSAVNPPPVSIDELEEGHSAHHHAETYPEAVAELEAMHKTIADAFTKGDISAADEPIHEVGHVLEELVAMAKKESMDETAIAAISAAVESLFDAFAQIDEKIHGGEGATYDQVKAEIEAGFKVLNQYVK